MVFDAQTALLCDKFCNNLIIDIWGYVFVFNNNKIDLSISGRHERHSKYNNSCAVVSYFRVFFLQLVVSLSRDYFYRIDDFL